MRLCLIFFNTRPAKGAPALVGTVISTMQRARLVRLPEDVALEAVEGSMMCSPLWSDMAMFFAVEKLGFLTPPTLSERDSSSL
ncbi:hypothetical protein RRF57_000960 [Xylaria bambusicola]|uniref:Uncharacterized protein n=1 Tax=Xylaria bambusicola TaxID=326684 RepID=A0AAN7U4A9_9PEZI